VKYWIRGRYILQQRDLHIYFLRNRQQQPLLSTIYRTTRLTRRFYSLLLRYTVYDDDYRITLLQVAIPNAHLLEVNVVTKLATHAIRAYTKPATTHYQTAMCPGGVGYKERDACRGCGTRARYPFNNNSIKPIVEFPCACGAWESKFPRKTKGKHLLVALVRNWTTFCENCPTGGPPKGYEATSSREKPKPPPPSFQQTLNFRPSHLRSQELLAQGQQEQQDHGNPIQRQENAEVSSRLTARLAEQASNDKGQNTAQTAAAPGTARRPVRRRDPLPTGSSTVTGQMSSSDVTTTQKTHSSHISFSHETPGSIGHALDQIQKTGGTQDARNYGYWKQLDKEADLKSHSPPPGSEAQTVAQGKRPVKQAAAASASTNIAKSSNLEGTKSKSSSPPAGSQAKTVAQGKRPVQQAVTASASTSTPKRSNLEMLLNPKSPNAPGQSQAQSAAQGIQPVAQAKAASSIPSAAAAPKGSTQKLSSSKPRSGSQVTTPPSRSSSKDYTPPTPSNPPPAPKKKNTQH
jgi:hypothetical protein